MNKLGVALSMLLNLVQGRISATNYARLVGDGVTVDGGDSGAGHTTSKDMVAFVETTAGASCP